MAELKCPTKEKLTKFTTFLVESIERVTFCCPTGAHVENDGGNSSNFTSVINDDILKIARGEDPSPNRYITSSASSSSSSSPLQKQR